MIDDIKTIMDIFTITVNRKFLSIESVIEYQRNQLFGEMVGAVIIGAVCNQCRQAIGMEVSADQVIG